VDSKIHRQCVLPWRPEVECYRNQVVMVGLGSNEKSALLLPCRYSADGEVYCNNHMLP
jgi:hypothetical protein